jgi:hypothetical protein
MRRMLTYACDGASHRAPRRGEVDFCSFTYPPIAYDIKSHLVYYEETKRELREYFYISDAVKSHLARMKRHRES